MARWLLPSGTIAAAVAAFLLFRPADDIHDWFPLAVSDRWTYRDAGHSEPVVFEVVGESAPGVFDVERRARGTKVVFTVSVSGRSVLIHGTSKGRFDPPLEELRLPPLAGERWVSKGYFGKESYEARLRVESASSTRCVIREETRGFATTTFEIERGKGVTRLTGKEGDVHNFGDGHYEWTLESFERR